MASYVLNCCRMDNGTGAAEGQTVQQNVESGAGGVNARALAAAVPVRLPVEIVTPYGDFSAPARRAAVTLAFQREAAASGRLGLERAGGAARSSR